MKKSKLKLEDLKVQSFVTSMVRTEKQTIDGGIVVNVVYAAPAVPAVTSGAVGSALTPLSASVIISTLVNSILDATKADNVGTANSNVICESDMCFTAYGWWCFV